MTAVDLGQRRRLRRDRRRAEPRAGAAEHGEHGEDLPFEAGRASAGITLGDQRCGVLYGMVGQRGVPLAHRPAQPEKKCGNASAWRREVDQTSVTPTVLSLISMPTFAVVAHCTYSAGPRLDFRMHQVAPGESDLPPMPRRYVATVLDDAAGRRNALGGVIFVSDTDADHPQMATFVRDVIETIPVLAAILEEGSRSVVLTGFEPHGAPARLSEADCRAVFSRQYTELAVAGRA